MQKNNRTAHLSTTDALPASLKRGQAREVMVAASAASVRLGCGAPLSSLGPAALRKRIHHLHAAFELQGVRVENKPDLTKLGSRQLRDIAAKLTRLAKGAAT